jgi:quinolinate synthase
MQHPKATVLVHPECSKEMRQVADCIGSTSRICKYAKESAANEFIVATEEGILHRLQKENPSKSFYVAYGCAICPNMKLTTLDKLYESLKEEKQAVVVPEETAKKARAAVERMFEVKY